MPQRRRGAPRLPAAIFAAAFAIAAQSAAAAPPSVEDFFRKDQYRGAVLSPSGRYLAMIVPVRDHEGVAVLDLETRTGTKLKPFGGGDALTIVWQTDERLLIQVGELQRASGEPPRESGWIAVDREGNYPWVWTRGGLLRVFEGTNDVLVVSRKSRGTALHRVDTVRSVQSELTLDTPGNVSRWVVDFDGVPRAAVADDLDHDRSAWYLRKSANDRWHLVEEAKLGRLSSQPMQFDPDGKILYVAARRGGEDRFAIYEYTIDSGAWKRAVAHPQRDIGLSTASFVVDYRARRLLGLRYVDDKPASVWFDTEWEKVQRSVDAALPDTVNWLQRGGNRWVVTAVSDREPGEVYLLDAKSMRLERLVSFAPWIDRKSMARAKWVSYPARDGLPIPALLTIPTGSEGKRVPLVVVIHGGPYMQASAWRFDREVQFFASRGYAVLQPQFRGTEGFGSRLFSSGVRRWGDEMQDDLEDGVKWAVAQEIADPARVCFYGASYGGYAAAWAAIKNADLIKCAVDYVGVTSIDYLFDKARTDMSELANKSTLMAVLIGDPTTERARFRRVNPLDNADRAGVPILLAYGGQDRRVPIAHGKDFRAALDRAHKEYEWVEYPREGHGFTDDEDVFDFYGRVERFLGRYLGGTVTTKSDAAPPAPLAPLAAPAR